MANNLSGQEFATVLSDKTTYEIEKNDDLSITSEYKILIKSKEGDKFSYFIDYIDKFKKLKKLEVVIRDENGKKIKSFSKNDGHEYSFSSSYEIDDSKIFAFNPEYKNYPYTVEVIAKTVQSDYLSIPTWVPRNAFHIGVKEADLEIIVPINKPIKYREENIIAQSVVEDSVKKVIKYHVENLESIDSKLRFRDFYNDQPKVLISPINFEIENSPGNVENWQNFGDWFDELNDESYELSDDTKSYLDNLDKTNTYEMIKEIYHFMQDRTRYISIQLGIGGFKSLPTKYVDKEGYGDCKALTNYMKNLLDYVGVKSNFVLVKAGRDVPDVNKDFSSNQFNHVYLGVPLTDTVYLECTSQISPAFYTGTFTDDRNVLWVEKNNSKIIRSQIYKIDDNKQLNKAIMKIDHDGNANLELNTINNGVFIEQLFMYKNAPENRIKEFQTQEFDYKDFTVDSYSLNRKDRDSQDMDIVYNISIQNIAQNIGDKLILPKVLLRSAASYIDESELYKYATIPRAIEVVDSVTLDIDEDYTINTLNSAQSIESEFGDYSIQIIDNGNSYLCVRKIRLIKGDYTKEEFVKFNEFWNKVKKAERKKIVMTSKT